MFRCCRIGLFPLLLASVILVACTGGQLTSPTAVPESPAQDQLTEVDVCLSGSSTNAPLVLAKQAGLYEKYGLSANLVTVESGSTAANALIAGDMDFCLMGSASLVNAALAGEDLVMTAGTVNQMFFALVVLPDIASAEQLKGTSLGSSGPGNASYTFLRMALSSLGLDPDRDVTLLSVGRTSDSLAAMEAGQIAGAVVSVPSVGEATRLGFRVLLNAADIDVPYQTNGLVTTREYVANNSETVLSFTKVLVEAIALMKQDKSQAISALVTALGLDPVDDAEFLNEVYDSYVDGYLERVPYPTEEGLQAVIDEARAGNSTALQMSAGDIIDSSFVAALDEEGFIDNLYEGQ